MEMWIVKKMKPTMSVSCSEHECVSACAMCEKEQKRKKWEEKKIVQNADLFIYCGNWIGKMDEWKKHQKAHVWRVSAF